ncbi:AAA family ATPase [Nonomuraea sp. NPDC049400]|uniref:AAA family ATPase n=1 Tax=Nonomuraea sp. NPDC049400 TaxID=3364352 RepID=UPI0037A5231F
MTDWLIYTGNRPPHDGIDRLPPPPPWRTFDGSPLVPSAPSEPTATHQAQSYRPAPEAIEQVNAALYLRRPLLVTGRPGTGKSSLAYSVAHELRLGPVLHWPITSRTTLRDGLYQYDPLTRLYQVGSHDGSTMESEEDIGRYIRLGPLGTALLPSARPRVLLIDEIDKSDIDLPNDLLTIFEKGEYEIPELARLARPEVNVMTADSVERATVTSGLVRCNAFPLVIMTSNGEREFPPAFLRRCMVARLPQPDRDTLTEIVRAHLGELADQSEDLIERFLARKNAGELATDQLLNAVHLIHHAAATAEDRVMLADKIMPYLGRSEDGMAEPSDVD